MNDLAPIPAAGVRRPAPVEETPRPGLPGPARLLRIVAGLEAPTREEEHILLTRPDVLETFHRIKDAYEGREPTLAGRWFVLDEVNPSGGRAGPTRHFEADGGAGRLQVAPAESGVWIVQLIAPRPTGTLSLHADTSVLPLLQPFDTQGRAAIAAEPLRPVLDHERRLWLRMS